MTLYFNGQQFITPTSVSAVNDSALANQSLTTGNVLCLIGSASGGKPKTALTFYNPTDAEVALGSGTVVTAIKKAFSPSAQTGGPNKIVVIRPEPALQATGVLKDGSNNTVIDLVSTDYGQYTNGIKYKIENGSTTGKKITTQLDNATYVGDNLQRRAFSVHYTGGQTTGEMTINATQLLLAAPHGTNVATIDLTVLNTVDDLVNRINAVANFTAVVLDDNDFAPVNGALDFVSNVDVKTATYTTLANLQACIDWINGINEGFITATRHTGAGAPPANVAFTYLTGGTDGVLTNNDWAACFTLLQTQDVQWVVPLSVDPAIHAMADAHVQYMSFQGRKERRAIVGGNTGQAIADVTAAAKLLNSDRTYECYPGYYEYDDNGVLTLYPPMLAAALVGGMAAGVNPGTALTNKAITVRGLEVTIRNPADTDPLISGGVLCFADDGTGPKVIKSCSTWLTNTNFNRVEMSTGVAIDFANREVRDELDTFRGQNGSPTLLAEAYDATFAKLTDLAKPPPNGPGVLVGDADNPAFSNIRVSVNGDILSVQFNGNAVIPINYTTGTFYAQPFTSTITTSLSA